MRTLTLFFAALSLATAAVAQTVGAMPADSSIFPVTLELPNADGDLVYTTFGSPQNFGPTVRDTIQGEAAWGFGATGDSLACEDIVTDLTGKFAVVRRGVCQFTTKVAKAARAGAVGVIICNDNRPGAPGATIGMAAGDSIAAATIPSAFVSEQDCRALQMRLDAGQTSMIRIAPISLWQGTPYWQPVVPELNASLPFPAPRALMFNYNPTDSIFEATLSMTTPAGQTTVLASYTDTIQPFTSEPLTFIGTDVTLEDGQGTYTFTFDTNLPGINTHTQDVEVTEDYFQTHGPIQADQITLTEDGFTDQGSRLRWGLAFTADADMLAEALVVGVCNGAELTATGVNEPFIELFVIDVDADNDGAYDAPNATSLTEFPGMSIIGGGEYEFSGDERCSSDIDDLISIDIFNEDGGGNDLLFEEGKTYIVYAEFASFGSGTVVVPAIQSASSLGDQSVVFPGEFIYTSIIETSRIITGFFEIGTDSGQPQARYQSSNPFSRLVVADPSSSTREPYLGGQLILAPNPASDFAQLDYVLATEPRSGSVEVLDATGRIITTYPLAVGARAGKLAINTRSLSTGLYTVRVRTDAGARSLKLTVAR